MSNGATPSVVPEIIRYFRRGRYVLGEVRGQIESVVLARVIGPKSALLKTAGAAKVVELAGKRGGGDRK